MNRHGGAGIRSIRARIALPLLAIQTLVALAIAISGAWIATRRVETEILNRFDGISSVLSNPQFPLTTSVLKRLRSLTGAHFILTDARDQPIDSSLEQLPEISPKGIGGIGDLRNAPRIRIEGTEYFGLEIPLAVEERRLVALYPVSLWLSTRRAALTMPILQGLCGFLAMAGVTAAVSGRIARKLAVVERGVGRIAGGHFDAVPTDTERPDEIDHLAGSINHMSRQIQDMQRTIENTEKMRVLAQVASGLAHQLRNSIAGARMAIQLHFKRCPVAERDDSIGVALRQLQLTEEQIRCLIARDGSVPTHAERVDLCETVGDVIALLEPKAIHSATKVEFERPRSTMLVTGLAEEIRTAIFNLINNAIEAARNGGTVVVRLSNDDVGGDVRLEITDDGPGISEAVRDSAGQPFVTTKPEGLGLGLFLARQVAERYHGELNWRREDETTIFEWRFPPVSFEHESNRLERTNVGPNSDRR